MEIEDKLSLAVVVLAFFVGISASVAFVTAMALRDANRQIARLAEHQGDMVRYMAQRDKDVALRFEALEAHK